MNVGDVIFQLLVIIIPVLVIAMIVYYVHTSKEKKTQLDRIEEKVDRLLEEEKLK